MRLAIEELAKIGSEPLSGETSISSDLAAFGIEGAMLKPLLQIKNGFYAFESALHVFSSEYLNRWNQSDLWKGEYGGDVAGVLFFAEDVFGEQFGVASQGIVHLDPETGEMNLQARTLEDWASAILTNYRELTGFSLAHEWQVENGPMRKGMRLVPKTPFVAGGDYAVSNLYAVDSLQGMRLRSELARQIKNLPDGAQIRFKVID